MRLLPALLFALSLLAEVSGMGGQWVLNEKRSRFGDNPRPGNVFLNIEHNEPKFKYTGTVNRAGEELSPTSASMGQLMVSSTRPNSRMATGR